MTPELADYAKQFRDIRSKADALAHGLSLQQFNWRPGPERWSIAECFEHLLVTGELVLRITTPVIDRGIREGKTGTGPFKYGWFAGWFESALEPPPKRRFRSPKPFAPTLGSSYDPSVVMHRFHALGDSWCAALERCNGLDLQSLKVQSAASRLFRYPLGANFRIQAAHERRHLWQAEQVRAAPAFPARVRIRPDYRQRT